MTTAAERVKRRLLGAPFYCDACGAVHDGSARTFGRRYNFDSAKGWEWCAVDRDLWHVNPKPREEVGA